MKTRYRESSAPAVGGGMLLVCFAVLCLTAFAALCLSSAAAEDRLSRNCAETTVARREAETEAESILARLRAGETLPQVEQDGDTYYYNVAITDRLQLQVELQRTETGYTVQSWRECPTGTWEADDSLDLWDGGGE